MNMKTVSGETVSARPVSLAKASRVISKFVTVDNGASAAISIYLRKAFEDFDELTKFHKGLRNPKSDRKSRKTSSLAESVGNPQRAIEIEDAGRGRRNRRKNKAGDEDNGDSEVVEMARKEDGLMEQRNKKKKKKSK